MAEQGMNLNGSAGQPVMGMDDSGKAQFLEVDANGGIRTSPSVQSALGYQQLTSLATAAGLTPPVGATVAVITAEAQAVRWRDDGTNPTGSVGMPLAAGASFTYSGNLAAIKFIEQATSAKLNVSYYK